MSVFLIAEAGLNHGGSLERAKALVRAAQAAGADAVKFQSFTADKLAHPLFAADQHRFFSGLELSRDDHFELAGLCQDLGIHFMSTPFDFGTADLLVELGVPALKLASGDLTNLPLIAHCARQGLPLFLSCGMASLAECADAYYCAVEEGAERVVLLHCTAAYPAPDEELNLRAIETLAGELFCEVGYSDHSVGISACLGAVALGASVIEKHLCLDGADSGPDIAGSADPAQFAELAAGVRRMELARGDGIKRMRDCEKENARLARRSVFYARDLPAGHVLADSDLAYLRPVIGLSPAEAYRFPGRTLGLDMDALSLASDEDIADLRKAEDDPAQDP